MTKRLCKFTLKDAESVYNMAIDKYRQQDKQGLNISMVRKKDTFGIYCLPDSQVLDPWDKFIFPVVHYDELLLLVRRNLYREIRKKEAVNILHKQVNRRINIKLNIDIRA